MTSVYLDHNATSPLRPEVRAAFDRALDLVRGNPSSLHAAGRQARHLLDEARERVAAALAVHEDEVVFTSGGTEANNLALQGVLRAAPLGSRLVCSAVEHSSVLATAAALGESGYEARTVGVDSTGTVDLDQLLAAAAAPGTRLVSVVAANNEIGTCMPLDVIAERLSQLPRRPRLHTDAVQALGRVALDLAGWGLDLASFSAHKLGGPLGVGVLVRRAGVELRPLMFGGAQEGGLRPGTENVPAIVAAALAIELAVRERESHGRELSQRAQFMWRELRSSMADLQLLGLPIDHARRLPGTLNLLAPGVDGKVLVVRLDLQGIECSAGSACASGSLEASHVLLALGLDETRARAGLRLSLGRDTSWSDARKAVDILRRTLGVGDATSARDTGL